MWRTTAHMHASAACWGAVQHAGPAGARSYMPIAERAVDADQVTLRAGCGVGCGDGKVLADRDLRGLRHADIGRERPGSEYGISCTFRITEYDKAHISNLDQ